MNISETLKKEWFVFPLLLAPFIASFILWDKLPEEVPIHFNFQGEADDWGPKWINAIMIPFIGVGIYVLLLVLPKIDPKKKITSVQKPVAAIRIITSLFFVGIYAFIMAASLGSTINFTSYILVGVGLLIAIVGNYMNSMKPNYFIGVRTPWTLENPEVWKRTHRLTSKLWVVTGIGMIALAFFPSLMKSAITIIILITILAVIPILYSYLVFKKIVSEEVE